MWYVLLVYSHVMPCLRVCSMLLPMFTAALKTAPNPTSPPPFSIFPIVASFLLFSSVHFQKPPNQPSSLFNIPLCCIFFTFLQCAFSKTSQPALLPFQYSPFLPYHGQLGAQPVKLDIFPRRISFCIFRGNFLKVNFLK